RQREHELILAVALAAFIAAAARASRAVGTRDTIPGDVVAVARQHEFAVATTAEPERRLGDILPRHAHLAAALHVGEMPLADHLLHRLLNLRLVAAQEALAIDRALAAAVRAAVDQVEHRLVSIVVLRSGHDDLCTRRYHSASRRTCFSV